MPSQPPSPKLKNCSNAPVFDAAPAPAPEGEPPELLVMGCALGAGIAKKVIDIGETRAYVLAQTNGNRLRGARGDVRTAPDRRRGRH